MSGGIISAMSQSPTKISYESGQAVYWKRFVSNAMVPIMRIDGYKVESGVSKAAALPGCSGRNGGTSGWSRLTNDLQSSGEKELLRRTCSVAVRGPNVQPV